MHRVNAKQKPVVYLAWVSELSHIDLKKQSWWNFNEFVARNLVVSFPQRIQRLRLERLYKLWNFLNIWLITLSDKFEKIKSAFV